jgi:hypothetical protein
MKYFFSVKMERNIDYISISTFKKIIKFSKMYDYDMNIQKYKIYPFSEKIIFYTESVLYFDIDFFILYIHRNINGIKLHYLENFLICN